MDTTEQQTDRITFQIELSTKKQFEELCKRRGSNMSVEIKRFIYQQLKENGK